METLTELNSLRIWSVMPNGSETSLSNTLKMKQE